MFLVDFATPGLFDRAGNIKFQDFLPFYISARLIAEHRAAELYNANVQARALQSILRQRTTVGVPYLYGPQVGLFFVPLGRLQFEAAAWVWAVFSLILYFACFAVMWKQCVNDVPTLKDFGPQLVLAAIAFPPLFHAFARAQVSALILVCFVAAYAAFRANQFFLAGVALGLLALKPQFLVALPLVLLFAAAWKELSGLILSAGAQLAFTRAYFGGPVLQSYLDVLFHPSRWVGSAELNLAPIQMHSLRSFFTLLIPSAPIALILYGVSSVAVTAIAVAIWKSSTPISLRFSALTLASVLVNPHLFIYDLLVLAPALMLMLAWTLKNPTLLTSQKLRVLSYLSFVLPLFGPLARWTHVQLSVIAFSALLWTLFCFATSGHTLASSESRVV